MGGIADCFMRSLIRNWKHRPLHSGVCGGGVFIRQSIFCFGMHNALRLRFGVIPPQAYGAADRTQGSVPPVPFPYIAPSGSAHCF
mgnify:FL=1